MRIIAVQTLKRYLEKHHQAEQSLLAWYEEAEIAQWRSPNELKEHYRNASVLTEYDTPYLLDNYCTNLRYNHDTFLIS